MISYGTSTTIVRQSNGTRVKLTICVMHKIVPIRLLFQISDAVDDSVTTSSALQKKIQRTVISVLHIMCTKS